jgi:hypothetical protein
MCDMTLNGVQDLLGEALGWSGLRCRVNALYRQFGGALVAVTHIPSRGLGEVRMVQIVSDSFCGDVQLCQLEREGIEYKAVFVLKPEALAGEAG